MKSCGESAARAKLGSAYADVIGYDITVDAPEMSNNEIVKIMREYDATGPDQPFKERGLYE